jgi:murein DD-endopeptidase MepM/ murein hydrolase activator NlpD
VITQVFGARPDYYRQFGLPGHEGIDYGGRAGDPIYAAAGGAVKLLALDNGVHPYGTHIRITHAHGSETFETIYAHLSAFADGLAVGDAVRAGQRIGAMGSSGNSTGVHLHFSLKRNGAIVDPAPYFSS